MVATSPRSSIWLCIFLLVSYIQLFPACLAQDITLSKSSSVTTQASAPGPSTMSTQWSSTISAPAQTHTIEVGLADHKFRPDVTEAAVGDTIEFRFYPANHSVVRAEYGFPCIPYEMTGSKKIGFFSGFNPVDKVVDDPPKYSLRINTIDPIFFYCSAPGSCINYGMVGAINPNASTSIDMQRDLAKGSAYMLNPGEPFPAESPLPSSNPATTSILSADGSKKDGLGVGAIAGIVVGAIVVLVLCAFLFFFWGRTKTLKDEVERKESTVARRVSPSSSAANMLQTTATPGTGSGSGAQRLGIYQHFAPNHISPSPTTPDQYQDQGQQTPAPGYFSPHAQLDMETERKHTSPPPAQGHPALAIPPAHSTAAGVPDTSFFQLSPSSHSQSYFPSISQLPIHHRAHSPLSLSIPQTKLGPYGQQEVNGPAPPYGWHANVQQGPVEMEGEGMTREREKWEEGRMF